MKFVLDLVRRPTRHEAGPVRRRRGFAVLGRHQRHWRLDRALLPCLGATTVKGSPAPSTLFPLFFVASLIPSGVPAPLGCPRHRRN